MAAVAERFSSDFPDSYPPEINYTPSVVDLKEELTRNARPTLMMLLVTAGIVLLIACANVANLTLARVIRRDRELAVRTALGAGRGRLLRQLVTESTLLAVIGGVVGLGVAFVGLDLLVGFVARFTPRAISVGIDGWVLAFTLLTSLATGLVFGVVPTLGSRVDLRSSIQESTRTTGSGKDNIRRGLIVAQVALSFVLLIGAGLTLRSLVRLQQVEPGFETEHVLTARISVNFTEFDTMTAAHHFLNEVADAVGESPLARAAALTTKPPYRSTNPFLQEFLIEGRDSEEVDIAPQLDGNVVSRGYFDVLDIPVLDGRAFEITDESESAPVGIVNRSLAERHWPGERAVGKRVSIDDGETWITIVGVVGDTRLYGPESEVTDEFYRPNTQGGMPTWLLVRTVGDPATAAQQVKEITYALSGANPISDIETLASLRDEAVASPRLTASLLGLFAALALVVTVTGIAGVMAFTVNQRTRELGLRMALGARKGSVLGLVVGQGMALVVAGLLLGVAGAIVFGNVISGLLYDTAPTDPVTFILVATCLLVASIVACLVPARRAISVDPAITLRAE